MQIFAGTSGFSYAEWCGRFYPEALPASNMLRFYASRLPTVEINNTFYRMPTREMVAAWPDQVPDSFCFAVKATRRITHQKRLTDVGADVRHLFGVIDVLGAKLGPVLFQLPPFLKKDLGVLKAFLSELPEERRAALEFRHPSWFSDDVYSALSERNVAIVGGDLDDAEKSPPLVATANFGYLRLRRPDYDAAGIVDWAERIQSQSWQVAYAYLKHEVLGPFFAEALIASLNGQEMPDLSKFRASIVPASQKPKSARSAGKAKPPDPSTAKAAKGRSSKPPPVVVSKPPTSRAPKVPEPRSSKAPEKRTSQTSSKPPSKSRKP